ncbi:MG2 domain-containing protein [Trichlorobacter ammonificans]|uniref:Alpha-2-macroglobulin domain protein n=1 Tax=Trichlorobacter ammonificans TaxID=2916410 RepID=A0ABM9DAL0_9BACT|nr:MG2 domain-containing protein [Trichlorobacter ammonificans]CAH2032200.1 Alpha-2-macroglobulin domain protein [Trichlorobacter ammonificans]
MRRLLAALSLVSLSLLFCPPLHAAKAAAPAYKVQVQVLSADSNQPVAGAEIRFMEGDERPRQRMAVRTDAGGNAAVTLPRGAYQFLVVSKGLGTSRNYLYLNEQPKQGTTVWLRKGATLSGRLTDAAGTAHSGFKLTLDRFFSAVTDKNGVFTFEDVESGGHDLNLEQPGFVFEKSQYPQPAPGKQLQMGNLIIRRAASLEVAGKLLPNRHISSLRGAQVTLSGKSVWRMERFKENSSLTLGGLPPGDYTVSFADERLMRAEKRITLAEGEKGNLTLDATPAPPELQLELYGDTILADKEVTLRANGLWTEQVQATIFQIPAERVIRGEIDFSKPEALESAGLKSVQTFKVTLKKTKNRHRSQARFKLPPLPAGVYLLHLHSGQATAKAAVVATNLALVAKSAPDTTFIQAVDIKSGKPLAGVRLSGDKGHQVVTTDTNGTADWNVTRSGSRVVGQHGNSLAILPLAASESAAERKTADLKGYLYTERTAYRPGQTVFYKGVLRQHAGDDYRLPAVTKVAIRVADPHDTALFEESVTSSASGSFSGRFTLPQGAALGHYSIVATADGGAWQGSFQVLEYRKPEFEVKLSSDKQFVLPGEQIPLALAARYYFGAPAAGGKLVWRVYSQPWQRDEQGGGSFGEEQQFGGYNEFLGEGEALLDQAGEAVFTVPAGSHEKPLFYSIEAEVTDLSGRQVSASTRVTVVPSQMAVSLKSEQYLLKPNQQAGFAATVQTWQGEQQPNRAVTVLVEQQQYDKKSKTFGWNRITTLEGRTGNGGVARFAYGFPKPGYYRLLAETFDDAKRRSVAETGAWVWQQGEGWASGYRELEAEFDKKSYRIGETARLILRTPAQGGTLLFTLEGRRIHQSRTIPVNQAVQVIEIPVTEELAPNIHVSISMVAAGRFFHQQGLLKVEHQPGRLKLTVIPEKESYAPGDRAKISVQAEAEGKPVQAELSLAVVDEAIFAVAPEIREEIYRFFRGRRDHLVQTIYSFPRMYLGGAAKDLARLAGNDDLHGIKVRKLFKDTAAWFPLLATNDHGVVSAEAELPDNLTRWRATAVGHTADSFFGSAQASFISRLPFMARLAVPRFMLAGDRLEIPGILNDAAAQEQQVQGRFTATGLTLLGETGFTGTLPANGALKKEVLVAAEKAGPATLQLSALGSEGKDSMEVEFPVLPRSLKREQATAISLASGRQQAELLLPGPAEPESGILRISFAPAIAGNLVPALSRLISFPYGCTEQTIARFVPAAYAMNLLKDDSERFPASIKEKLPVIISQGLKQLAEMQQEDGGWGWWKNGSSDRYLTALVMQGLAKAMAAGVVPEQGMLERGKEALTEQLKQAEPEQAAFLYRALTAHGGTDPKVEAALLAQEDTLTATARIAVADALANRGQKAAAAALLQKLTKRLARDSEAAWLPEPEDGWRLGRSSIEGSAALLSALSRILPDDPALPRLARYLARNQQDGWWRTTAASAAGVLALADFVAATGQLDANYTARLTVNGAAAQSYRVEKGRLVDGTAGLTLPAQKGGNSLVLEKSGDSGIAWLGATLAYRVPLDQPVKNSRLGLKRSYYRIQSVNDNGRWRHEYLPLKAGEAVQPGDDLEVRVEVQSDTVQEYVILEDYLPAGFELRPAELDPRYAAESYYRGWYDHREQRDTYLAWFIQALPAGSHQFRYVIRPELKGKVTALPVAIWPMYNPQLRSEGEAEMLEVR